MSSDGFDQLSTEVRAKRSCGQVWIKRIVTPAQSATPTDRADALVASLGLKSMGDRWFKISRPTSRNLLVHFLQEDLAYNARLMPTEDANRLAADFLSYFNEGLEYFTNGPVEKDGTLNDCRAWNPITDATFDGGIIAVAPASIGILWVSDED